MVPFVDLVRYHSPMAAALGQACARVISEGQFSGGEELQKFETTWAAYCHTKYCVGVGSGLDAIKLALLAVDVRDRVVVTVANTFSATAAAAVQAGAKVELLDCDQHTRLIDIDYLTDWLKARFAYCPPTMRPYAIIPVHLYGQMADMSEIMRLARQYDMKVLEDACQAHGATHYQRLAGSLGDAGAFSFYPAKNLGAFGDGGAVVTNNEELADKIRALRIHGQTQKNHHAYIGYTSRLDELQAAILNVKFPMLDQANRMRQHIAADYTKLLAPCWDRVQPVLRGRGATEHVYHIYALATKSVTVRDRLLEAFKEQCVGVGVHYPVPIHLQPAFKGLGYRKGDFPHAERLAERTISLPMFPGLHSIETRRVVKVVESFQK
jgi:dTDP-4-amino-4,6-dideoxygalactose transaminase